MEKETTRIDLEQDILACMNVIEDLRKIDNENDIEVLAKYYDLKFKQLWNTFEWLTNSGDIK
jgi:hypothetical protein